MQIYLSENKMQPKLISARFFDTIGKMSSGIKSKKRNTVYYEFSLYLTNGGKFIDGKTEYSIKKGSWRFTEPERSVSSIPPYKCKTVLFSLADFENDCAIVKNSFTDAFPPFFESRNFEELSVICDKIIEAGVSVDIGSEVRKKALLFSLMDALYNDFSAIPPESSAEKCVREAKQIIENDFQNDITLEDLGKKCGYHPLYLRRIFIEKLGKTPHEYQRQIRLANAKKMLFSTSLPISEISEKCGYGSVSHFNATFKKEVGQPPLSYRKKTRIVI